jgi:hypothetical protein
MEIITAIADQLSHQLTAQTSKKVPEQNVTTICEIISTLKLLQGDFKLSMTDTWKVFQSIYTFTQNAQCDEDSYRSLKETIYELEIGFLNSRSRDSNEM